MIFIVSRFEGSEINSILQLWAFLVTSMHNPLLHAST